MIKRFKLHHIIQSRQWSSQQGLWRREVAFEPRVVDHLSPGGLWGSGRIYAIEYRVRWRMLARCEQPRTQRIIQTGDGPRGRGSKQ